MRTCTSPGPPSVGRYGVDLEAFERLALPELSGAEETELVLIDELGKMELASEAFRAAVSTVFEGAVPIVATVHVARHPFTEELKQKPSVETMRVSHSNRDQLPGQLAAYVMSRRGAE